MDNPAHPATPSNHQTTEHTEHTEPRHADPRVALPPPETPPLLPHAKSAKSAKMKRPFLILPILALAAVAIAAGSIWGCAADKPAIQTVNPSALRFAFGDGEAGSLTSFDFSSKEESLVRDWIAGLGKGGTVSFVTYAPGPLTVSSPDFTANFLADGTLVLNAKNASGSGWTQTVRERTAVDSAFFDLVTEKLIANLVTIPTVPLPATNAPATNAPAAPATHAESGGGAKEPAP